MRQELHSSASGGSTGSPPRVKPRGGILVTDALKGVRTEVLTQHKKISREDSHVRFGAEYVLSERLGLRAGYNGEDLTMGASLYVPISGHQLKADYCYQNDILEIHPGHYVSLGIVF